jgi:transcriptional regulator with XRE-family HTH domain
MSSGEWKRLGQIVRAERVRLGYHSVANFAKAAGLSSTTVDNIENARKTSYRPDSVGALELALGWRSGSVELVLAGQDPEAEADADLAVIVAAWPRLSPGARRMLRILATEGARLDS